MTLSTLQKLLENEGFEVALSDTLQAAKEVGNKAVEISVDSGGGCLVVIKRRENIKNKKFKYKSKSIPIVCEINESRTFRVLLETPLDFDIIKKEIDEE